MKGGLPSVWYLACVTKLGRQGVTGRVSTPLTQVLLPTWPPMATHMGSTNHLQGTPSMAQLLLAYKNTLQGLSVLQASGAFVYCLALFLAGAWTTKQVWFSFPSGIEDVHSIPWELLCVENEIAGRKCIVAVGGHVSQGRYLLAIGWSSVGIISIGQVAVGLLSLGWLACGAIIAVGVSALACPGIVYGLVVFGGLSPHCIVGFTVMKTPLAKGVLNLSPLPLSGLRNLEPYGSGISKACPKKAKESPRLWEDGKYDEEGCILHQEAPHLRQQQDTHLHRGGVPPQHAPDNEIHERHAGYRPIRFARGA